MRGGNCSGASDCGTQSFGTPQTALSSLSTGLNAQPNSLLFTGVAPSCGMTGGKYPKKKRGMKKRKSHGGSGLTAIAVPAVLVAANQMYSRKGRKSRKGKSFRRRRSMRGGSYVAATADMDSSLAHGMNANHELSFGKVGANVGIEAGVKTMGEITL